MTRTCHRLVIALLLCVSIRSGWCAVAMAQNSRPRIEWEDLDKARSFPTSRIRVPGWRLTDGPQVRAAFRETVETAQPATVRILTEGREAALGAIVDADGLILTKASQLVAPITCRLADQRELLADVVGIDREYDLALLKVKAEGLPKIDFEGAPKPSVGAWLASVGMQRGPLAVGVVSVGTRQIAHRFGVLGVQFDNTNARPIIDQVFPDTAAEKAGLKIDDELLALNGEEIESSQTFIRRVQEFSPGDQVKLRVRRGDETFDVDAHLLGRRPWRMPTREEFQNQLGSPLSQRRFGFPQAFQHDTVVKPTDCGGPVVDLDGKVVGLNIARAGRTETYAIPSSVVWEVYQKLAKKDS